MDNIIDPPGKGNHPHTRNNIERPGVLLDLDKAEGSAFLTFTRCRGVFEKTGAMSDQLKLFEARTAWDRIYYRIQEMESME